MSSFGVHANGATASGTSSPRDWVTRTEGLALQTPPGMSPEPRDQGMFDEEDMQMDMGDAQEQYQYQQQLLQQQQLAQQSSSAFPHAASLQPTTFSHSFTPEDSFPPPVPPSSPIPPHRAPPLFHNLSGSPTATSYALQRSVSNTSSDSSMESFTDPRPRPHHFVQPTSPRRANGFSMGYRADCENGERKILSNVVMKQGEVHESFGGIHPLHAQEAHQRNMPLAISKALKDAGLKLDQLDGVAWTRGPGMYGCLSVCAGAGKTLAAAAGVPSLGVHHMQAHALTPLLTEKEPLKFPFLTLLISGGHTLLVLAKSESSFEIIATTHDESIGASFDKACRDLQIPWSLGVGGSPGAALEAFASFPTAPSPLPASTPSFPVPFKNQLAFSYAGVRSALTRVLADEPVEKMSEERKRDIARGFMAAAVEQVEDKVKLTLKKLEEEGGERLGAVVASGGVASNVYLRGRLRKCLDENGYSDLPMIFPPVHLCTDNAAMIAWVGIMRLQRGRIDSPTTMQRAKWSIEEAEADFEK
ncbi:hypothetical protein MNV49_003829 [Pseudohyphozyma bogoriensis]|nr:hypothetical protein MNV49_003829 [Pseudohyphozyma bogoriensis]